MKNFETSGIKVGDNYIIQLNEDIKYRIDEVELSKPYPKELFINQNSKVEAFYSGDISIFHYVDKEENILTFEEHNSKEYDLELKYEESRDFEDEYIYKKFLATWTPIYKTTSAGYYPVNITTTLYNEIETDIPYIRSLVYHDNVKDYNTILYRYTREDMYLDTIKEFMSKVNLTDSGLTDSVGTVKHPIDKYTIEYYDNDYTITAFKSYITIKKPHQNYVGTLEEMIVKYNEDKKYIETLLIVAYQNNNKLLGLDEAVYSTLADKLNIIQSYINCIKVKKESEYQLNHLDNYVKETIEILKNYGLSQFNSSTL